MVPTAIATILLCSHLCVACLESAYVLRSQPAAGGANDGGAPGSELAGGGNASASLAGAGTGVCDGVYQSGNDLVTCAAAYWGSNGVDALHAALVTPQGDVLIAGHSAASDLGVPTLALDGASTGVVLRISAADGGRLSAARVGANVTALGAVGGNVVVASDLGVTVLTSDLAQRVGEDLAGSITRLAVTNDSVAALTADGRVLRLDAGANPQVELDLGNAQVEDLALDAGSGLVVVTGSRAPVAGAQCLGRLPFIHAYNEAGARVWTAYDFDDAPGWCASSTGRRLVIANGKLFYAGEQEGGNSVHLRDPVDLAAQAALVSHDEFSTGAGKAPDEYSFVARFELATGALETGQVIVPRSAGVGGTLFTSALAVDGAGHIFLGGRVTCCIEKRDEHKVSGELVGPYAGEEASLLVLSPDFGERLSWTTFTSSTGAGPANVEGIALGAGVGLAVMTTYGPAALITVPPGATAPLGADDGYFVTFPAP